MRRSLGEMWQNRVRVTTKFSRYNSKVGSKIDRADLLKTFRSVFKTAMQGKSVESADNSMTANLIIIRLRTAHMYRQRVVLIL